MKGTTGLRRMSVQRSSEVRGRCVAISMSTAAACQGRTEAVGVWRVGARVCVLLSV